MALTDFLKGIADAIRAAEGSSESISAGSFAARIAALKASLKLQRKSVTPTTTAQTVTADDGYDGLEQVTVGAVSAAAQATPSISVSSAGLITASATQSAGYVAAGTKSATKQLTTQAAKTVTPGTSAQTAVSSGVYTTGAVTVAGDSNLVAGNIKSGVSIFGVSGNYAGSGGDGWELLTFNTLDGTGQSAEITSVTPTPANKKIAFKFSKSVTEFKPITIDGLFGDGYVGTSFVAVPSTDHTDDEQVGYIYDMTAEGGTTAYYKAITSGTAGTSHSVQFTTSALFDSNGESDWPTAYYGHIAVKWT